MLGAASCTPPTAAAAAAHAHLPAASCPQQLAGGLSRGMAFEMSLPHAPRIQALAPDGGETHAEVGPLSRHCRGACRRGSRGASTPSRASAPACHLPHAQDEAQWALYYSVQQALQEVRGWPAGGSTEGACGRGAPRALSTAALCSRGCLGCVNSWLFPRLPRCSQEAGAAGGGESAAAAGEDAAEGGKAASAKAPQPSDPQKVLSKLLTARVRRGSWGWVVAQGAARWLLTGSCSACQHCRPCPCWHPACFRAS